MSLIPSGPRFQPIIGLDISTSAIKIAELRKSGKDWRLHRCGYQKLPPESVVDSQIKDIDTVAKAITDLLKEHKITTKAAAISVSGSAIIIKKIQIARMPELDLEDQISAEAEEYIPFDIEEIFLDFQVLNRETDPMDVLLVACKKELINNYQKVLDIAGLKMQIVDLDLFCIANAYQCLLGQPGKKETVALINAGASLINCTILESGVPSFTRDHAFGGRHLTEEIKRHYDVNFDEAERIQTGQVSRPEGYQEDLVQPFLEQFHMQVGQSIDLFQNSHQDHPIEKVILTGGCALTPGIDQFMHSQTNLPVEIADPFSRIKPAKDVLANVAANSRQFMVALGLALRGGER